MYLRHFGFRRTPFKITPDTKVFFKGCNRGVALHALCFAIARGEGIIKVVGEVGTGKTMLCRMLPLSFKRPVDWVYLPHPSLSPEHTLHSIAHELGLATDEQEDKLSVMRKLHRALLLKHAKGRHVVLLVEEAQGMPIETLEEIRLLSNLETEKNKLLQIVLFGQPELDQKLAQTTIRQLKERITYSLHLDPLSTVDIQNYINFRIRASGYRGPHLFNHRMAKVVERYSGGLIRRINIIADKSLLSAYVDNRHCVKLKDIHSAAQDSEYVQPKKWFHRFAAASFASAILGGQLIADSEAKPLMIVSKVFGL